MKRARHSDMIQNVRRLWLLLVHGAEKDDCMTSLTILLFACNTDMYYWCITKFYGEPQSRHHVWLWFGMSWLTGNAILICNFNHYNVRRWQIFYAFHSWKFCFVAGFALAVPVEHFYGINWSRHGIQIRRRIHVYYISFEIAIEHRPCTIELCSAFKLTISHDTIKHCFSPKS